MCTSIASLAKNPIAPFYKILIVPLSLTSRSELHQNKTGYSGFHLSEGSRNEMLRDEEQGTSSRIIKGRCQNKHG